MPKKYIGAIDQGTTSSRFILFDREGRIKASNQIEHKQIYPQPGYVEHDPMEIWNNTRNLIVTVLEENHIPGEEIAALGITNQRETTVMWNPKTGLPYQNAIVWQDTRTIDLCKDLENKFGRMFFQKKTGLPPATYFSGPKIKWILDDNPELSKAASSGELLFGTIDSWLIWNLTGGRKGGSHITDVTNASRTMLMDIQSLSWDPELLKIMSIPAEILPEIRASSDSKTYGITRKDDFLKLEIPVCGDLGDQQAALFGQNCFLPGDAKNTYGTGCFLLMNTGNKTITSQNGLLTTVGYKIGEDPACYALEGSIAIAGSLVQWLRDNFDIIKSSEEIEALAASVKNNGGVYFVPAFSGLFAPHWNSSARGTIIGLTHYINKQHLSRAVLEATAFQTREVFEAINKDSGLPLNSLKVDGGMTANNLLMQFQADILNVDVIKPVITETTALGAAFAAGLAVGFWKDVASLKSIWKADQRWTPRMNENDRSREYRNWKKAVARAKDWID